MSFDALREVLSSPNVGEVPDIVDVTVSLDDLVGGWFARYKTSPGFFFACPADMYEWGEFA